jgi:hypothetical protein
MVPGRGEPLARVLEGVVGFGGVPTGTMESLRQLGYLKRAARLQALVDRPRIAAGRRDQFRFGEVVPRHGTASSRPTPTTIAAPF